MNTFPQQRIFPLFATSNTTTSITIKHVATVHQNSNLFPARSSTKLVGGPRVHHVGPRRVLVSRSPEESTTHCRTITANKSIANGASPPSSASSARRAASARREKSATCAGSSMRPWSHSIGGEVRRMSREGRCRLHTITHEGAVLTDWQ